jgi:starch-binding outer membrane protein, SusD/RagB family
MKKSNYIKFFVALVALVVLNSCNEEEFLKEVPVGQFTSESVFSSPSGVEAVLTNLYVQEREIYYAAPDDITYTLIMGSDTYFSARGANTAEARLPNLTSQLVPTSGFVKYIYEENFKMIATANLLIKSVNESELSNDEKNSVIAEAKFFRAKAYRDMVYLYGGLPLVVEFSSEPVLNRVRATKIEILNQMEKDFRDAANGMLSISSVNEGRVSNIVASFYLGETLISLGRPAEAAIEISKVINDPNVALMKARFGRRLSVAGKDVIWDLNQNGNHNRGSGNKEALWVAQFEVDVPGGLITSTGRTVANVFERYFSPAVWSITDPDGRAGFLGPQSNDNIGGNGVGFVRPLPYTTNTVNDTGGGIWPANYVGDLRCSDANLVKDAVYDNPSSAFFGRKVSEARGRNMGAVSSNLNQAAANGDWRSFKYFTKSTTPGDHPSALFQTSNPLLLSTAAGTTYHDQYYLRLAEAYLLRAEAYLNAGNLTAAANDINEVRRRAGATLVAAGDVTIDYILDERTRELNFDEKRQVTLRRVGKYEERVKKYNAQAGPTYISPRHDLFPIPQSEIEANTGAILAQNPGYDN